MPKVGEFNILGHHHLPKKYPLSQHSQRGQEYVLYMHGTDLQAGGLMLLCWRHSQAGL